MDPTTLAKYYGDEENYSVVGQTVRTLPDMAWAIPYVTGHKYKIHWEYGLDWT